MKPAFSEDPRAQVRLLARTASLLVALAGLSACGGGSGTSAPAPAPVAPPPSAAAPSLTLRAHVAGFGAGAAQVQIRHNGALLATAQVSADSAQDHVLELPAPLGSGTLELVYLNADPAAGRALHVQSLQFQSAGRGTTLTPTDNQVLFDQGEGPLAFDGLDQVPGKGVLTQAGALRFAISTDRMQTLAAAAENGTQAPGVYVDAERGSDSNPGTQALPWRSLAKVTAARLLSGHGIYLRCGSQWRESLTLSAAQLERGAVIAGYGPECSTRKATLSGADDFSLGWRKSGAAWVRDLPPGTPKITQLFVDGQALRPAQWPNPSAAGQPRSALVATAMAPTSLGLSSADAAALAGKDLQGAAVQLRTQPWLLETRRISAVAAGQLTLDSAPRWALQPGEGFVLQDKLWMLDSPGEFFHDTRSQQLHLIAPVAGVPADINTARIEGSVRDVALALSQVAALSLRDIAVRAARVDGLTLTDTPEARISGVHARDNGGAGMRLWQWLALPATLSVADAGPRISDSLVAGNGHQGIDAVHTSGARIERVLALANGVGLQHQGPVAAALAAGPGARIENNIVDGAGYGGIHFSAQNASVVAGNTVSGYCKRLSDCGGIYTWTGRVAAAAAANLSATVERNRVLNASAWLEGAVSNGREVVAGIYIDDHSHGARVQNNLLVGMPMGVLVHNASNVSVSSNRIWQPTRVGLWATMDESDADSMVGNRFTLNEIVPLVHANVAGADGVAGLPTFSTSQAVWFWHSRDGAAALASTRNHFSGNRVLQLQGALAAHVSLRGPGNEQLLDAVAWRKLNPAETLPIRPARFAPLALTLGPELVADAEFDAGLGQWRPYRHAATPLFAVQAVAQAPGCNGPCASLSSGDPGDLLASQPFTLRTGATYVYRHTTVWPAGSGGTVGLPYISRETSPWDSMADGRGFAGYGSRNGAGGEILPFESFFVAKAAEQARVNLQLESLGVPVHLDGVSLREVLGMRASQSVEWSALAYARPDSARSVDCADLGWPAGCSALDLLGQPLPLPLQLAAGEERLVLRADSVFRR
jgi:parallel beta-helix repeat protein